jgi:predicted lipoprotein with Yx(FWY)xxD motif
MKRSIRVAAAAVAGTMAVCGTLAFSARPATNSAATVTVRKTRLGTILVDSRGRSLYSFADDTKGSIVCTSSIQNCTTLWPPLMTTGRPHAGPGARASLLGTARRTKPTGVQVTYNGHPLYTHEYDKRPGDLNGQGYYGVWYVLSPNGKPVKKK